MSRKFTYILRWCGYGFLLMAGLDILQSFVPLQISSPLWGMATMSNLVERVPIPILGFLFVFWGEEEDRRIWEEKFLPALLWLCLGLGIVFLLMMPSIAINTFRIDRANTQQIDRTLQQEEQQLGQLSNQINQANLEQLRAIATQLKSVGMAVNIDQPQPQLKADILVQISNARTQMPDRAAALKNNQILELSKKSLKLFLGALIAGVLYLQIWRHSSWIKKLN
ncbi:MAG: hypothetical protein HC916_10880 [Coleofasciculaceae cyanobacterium SM2_1_6]|nr:hypothetical protein [Coleofasciculaceae cyanobacterium SM2_1_6]